MTTPDDDNDKEVDAALAKWRQGDCVLEGDHWFVHRQPEAPAAEGSVVESEVPGFVVITQSCDLVREYKHRPLVCVSPLAQVGATDLVVITKGYRPQFAAIPALASSRLVADLDRVMTVDKRIVATWRRVEGCRTDGEKRDFGRAVGRKHSRFAFPDDFNEYMSDLLDRIKEKNGKESPEGIALRELHEIRVRAAPSWDAEKVEVTIWFVAVEKNVEELRRSGVFARWERLLPSKDRFRVYPQIATYRDLTAQDYIESDRLDLDHLSPSAK